MATPPDSFSLDTIRDLLREYPDLRSPRQSLFASRSFTDALTAQFPVEPAPVNPIYTGATSYLGMTIRTFDIPKQKVYDWSGCRSPSRAKRRHAKGIPQQVKITEHDVAYLVNEDALRSMRVGWERMCGKILFDGSWT